MKRSRKPIRCPACKGKPYYPATHLDPAEECETCRGVGRVSQRAARRYRTAATRPLPAALRL